MEHEADKRPEWANRPRIGDKVADRRTPRLVVEVVDTFYGNGEGGMHVLFGTHVSWACCHMVDIVETGDGRPIPSTEGASADRG